MWNLVSWPGMEPGHPALGVWSPSHWNMREGPPTMFFGKLLNPSEPLECHQRNENNNRTFLWLCMCMCVCVCVCVCNNSRQHLAHCLACTHSINIYSKKSQDFPGGTMVKNLPSNAGDARDAGLVPRLGRSTRGGNGNPFQYSCLETSMDRGAWSVSVHGVSKELDWLSNWACMQ